MFTSTIVLASLFSAAFGTVFVTSPIAGTVCNGGQQCQVKWQDDGHAPSLQAFGNAIVSVYTGNAIQQTMIQNIVPSVNVGTANSLVFTVDPTAGANSDDYFIRFQALNTSDPNNPTFPAEAFSAKFTMQGMTGTFNATVLAQISGTVTAPIGGPTGTPVGTATSQPSGMVTSVASSVVPSSTVSASSSTSAAGAANGALSFAVAPIASFATALLTSIAFTLYL